MKDLKNYSVDPKIWGKYYWYVLNSIAHNYPRHPDHKTKNHVHGIFEGMKSALPCSICRKHYAKYLHEHDIKSSLKNKEKLEKWVKKCEKAMK